MFFRSPYPFVRFTGCFIVGIVLYTHIESASIWFKIGMLSLIGIYIVLFFTVNRSKAVYFQAVFGITGILTIVCFGTVLTHLRTARNDKDNLVHFENEKIEYFRGVIVDRAAVKAKGYTSELQLSAVKISNQWREASGRVLLYIGDSAARSPLSYGDELLVYGNPYPVKPPMNPGAFNYKEFLATKNIYHQLYLNPGDYKIIDSNPPNPIINAALAASLVLDKVLQKHIKGDKEYAVAAALFLGIRDHLNDELVSSYQASGVMHILAVSGLHVAVIFQLLTMLFARIPGVRNNRFALNFLPLLFIWLYAFITGMSPSVMRAAVMFSFILGSKAFLRQTNIFNTLAVSAFFLLCYNPYYVLSVGFQLSYAAVFGIVYLYPKLYRLVEFNNQAGDKAWTISCVSISAQAGTFPLSLFYFHKFPVYFLIANIVMIPLVTLVMYGGVLLLLLNQVPYVADGLGFVIEKMIGVMNGATGFIEGVPGSLIDEIRTGVWAAVLIYGIVAAVTLFFQFKKLKYIVLAAAFTLLVIILDFRESIILTGRQELTVYSVRNESALALTSGTKSIFLSNKLEERNPSAVEFNIAGHRLENRMTKVRSFDFNEISESDIPCKKLDFGELISFNARTILIVNKKLPHTLSYKARVRVDYILIQNNMLRDWELERLLEGFECKTVIIDGSNSSYSARYLKEKTQALKVPVHNTAEDGAFTVTW